MTYNEAMEQIVLDYALYYLNLFWDVLKNWWWILPPFLLYRPFLFWWLWWRQELWNFSQKSVLLEIKMPKEVLKPMRAMEQVFIAMWANVFDPPDPFWERWIEGKQQISVQLEMVSLGGIPHFYIRTNASRRPAVESSIYSQYPDAEISVAEDYTKYVPQDMPNKNWEMWGTDYMLVKPEVYPIQTYTKFFEEHSEAKEEKRIDPMATLLEGMGQFKPGEQLWIQIAINPIISSSKPYEGREFIKAGRKLADKLAKRPEESKKKSILTEATSELISGTMPGGEKKEQDLYPVEMRLTPGEKDAVAAVEGKVSKRCFDVYIRFICMGKKEAYFGGGKAIPLGFFNQFATENLNQLKPWPKTLTKVKRYPILDLLRARRTFIKKRRLFFRYTHRFSPLYPKPGGKFILNTEELATIFHFPGRTVAPAPFVPRVESKRGEAPSTLPFEE